MSRHQSRCCAFADHASRGNAAARKPGPECARERAGARVCPTVAPPPAPAQNPQPQNPPEPAKSETQKPAAAASKDTPAANHPATADDICHAIEQGAAANGLPVEFFARVIWQESRFNAQAVSSKGAQGIAQFMPATADVRGLADPFDPVAALHEAASYLGDLRKQFGNLGLAAAGYNAGPGRVNAWLDGRRRLPRETRDYVAIITGWTADEWASASPPKEAETTIPQGVPCTRLANLVLAKPDEAHRIAAHVPRWGAQLTANLSESERLGDLPDVAKALCGADRRPRTHGAARPAARHGQRRALHDPRRR